MAAAVVGVFYIIVGIFGATVGPLFAALPQALVAVMAKPCRRKISGLALLGTIGKGLATALANDSDRDAALITFLVTASGVSLFSIGSVL